MAKENSAPDVKLEAKAFPLKEQKGNLLAFASITIADSFAINGVKVLEGNDGLFVGMPSASDGKGGFRDIAFPTTAEMRAAVTASVLDAYKDAKMQALDKSLSSQLKAGAEKAAEHPKKEVPKKEKAR